MTITPWHGGRRLLTASAAVGAGGLALTAVGGLAFDARRALFSYLVAFVSWLAIVLGVLIVLGAFHAANARWPIVLRRFLENAGSTVWVFVVLFVPIAAGMRRLYPWVEPSGYQGALARTVQHRAVWLNPKFFLVRAAVYFAVWIVVGELLRAWSVRQDEAGGVTLTARQRRLGAGSLPFIALTLAFASFDWMMSLDPRFYSTMFGVYWFAGGFMSAFAVAIIAAALTRTDPVAFGHFMNVDHFHSLGKFLLAFVAFWGYIAFSQFMLIWIANIPEEVPWYILRVDRGWAWVGALLAIGHFLVPFFLLLQRRITRNPRALAWLAAWLLLMQWIDLYWVVMPHLHPDGPRPWLFDLTAFAGVGGVVVAFAVLRMRGVAAVPVRDPYLDDSLRYSPQ